jgi:hypothetical protein
LQVAHGETSAGTRQHRFHVWAMSRDIEFFDHTIGFTNQDMGEQAMTSHCRGAIRPTHRLCDLFKQEGAGKAAAGRPVAHAPRW